MAYKVSTEISETAVSQQYNYTGVFCVFFYCGWVVVDGFFIAVGFVANEVSEIFGDGYCCGHLNKRKEKYIYIYMYS